MTTPMAIPAAEPVSALLGQPPEPLSLRIASGPRAGQTLRLRAGKIAVGSSPRATLRISAPGVSDCHCLILRGRRHTVVRRWKSDTRLNGEEFGEACLRRGDRLSIGPFDLEVTGYDSPATSPALPASEPSDHASRLEAERAEIDRQRRELENLRNQWNAASADEQAQIANDQAELERRRREIENKAEVLQRRQDDLDGQRSLLEAQIAKHAADVERLEAKNQQLDAASLELASKQALLDSQQQELAQLRQQVEDNRHSEVEHLHAELGRQQTEIAIRQADLDRHREELAEHATRLDERETQLKEQSEQLDARYRELEQQQEKSARQADELSQRETDLNKRESTLRQREASAAEREQALLARESALSKKEHTLTAPDAAGAPADKVSLHDVELPVQEPAADVDRTNVEHPGGQGERTNIEEPTSAGMPAETDVSAKLPADAVASPADDDDVFARLRAMSLLKDHRQESNLDAPTEESEPQDSSLSPHSANAADEAGTHATNADYTTDVGNADDGDEESIDDYMARLMQRVKGIASPKVAPTSQSPTSPPPAPKSQSATDTPRIIAQSPSVAAEAANSASPTVPKEPIRFEPLKAAPEKFRDLAAMREIANLAARTAIEQHSRSARAGQAWSWLLGGIAAIAIGIALFVFDLGLESTAIFGGIAALLAGSASIGFGIWLLRPSRPVSIGNAGNDGPLSPAESAAGAKGNS